MSKTIEHGIKYLTVAILLLLGPELPAQNPPTSAPAPIPPQIIAARKLFISNASGEDYSLYFATPDQPYNQFYNALKSTGSYELMTAPAEADLVLELHFAPYKDAEAAHLTLAILDPKTRITLWTIEQPIAQAARQATGRKNFGKALSALVQNVEKLITPSATTSEAPNK